MSWDERYDYDYTDRNYTQELSQCLARYIPHQIICVRSLIDNAKKDDRYAFEVVEELENGTRRKNIYFPAGLGTYGFCWLDMYLGVYDKRLR